MEAAKGLVRALTDDVTFEMKWQYQLGWCKTINKMDGCKDNSYEKRLMLIGDGN